MENKNILVTGASGNIGYETIRGLWEIKTPHTIFAADYKPENAQKVLAPFGGIQYRKLDFAHAGDFDKALEGIDIVFLLRPPQLADIPKYFAPFAEAMKRHKISKVVFLSVQGVESQSLIPHHKLEKLLVAQRMEYVFLRPSYFMQNLTTTLLHEIKTMDKIFIPSGPLKFNWVDARDIGLVAAHVLSDFDRFSMQALEVTGSEFIGFKKVAQLLSQKLNREIRYESPNLMQFFRAKRNMGVSKAMIFVMIMLHYLPRFGKNLPRLTNVVEDITGKKPGTLAIFIERESARFC
jgi:uncharacterized protein YbjT (DUF2867 family)